MKRRLSSARLRRRLYVPIGGVASSAALLVFACSSNDYSFTSPGGSSGISSTSSSSGIGSSSGTSGFFDDAGQQGDFPAQAIVKTTLLDRDPDASLPDAEAVDAGPDGCSIPLINIGSFGPPAAPVKSGALFDGGRGKLEVSCSVREVGNDLWAVTGTVRLGNGEFVVASTVNLNDEAKTDADLLIRPEGVGGAAWSWNNCAVTFPSSAAAAASNRAWLTIKCGVSTGLGRPFCGVEAEARFENCAQNKF